MRQIGLPFLVLRIPFAVQFQTLANTKAVLFIQNHQAQLLELHIVLNQGLGADGQSGLSGADGLISQTFSFDAQAAA